MAQLAKEKARLTILLKAIRDSIEKIRSEYPYTMKTILADAEKTGQKKRELEHILRQSNELVSFYQAKLKEMMRYDDE